MTQVLEDYSLYTEVDPNSRFIVTPTKITWAPLLRPENAWIYSDKGADFFDKDFTFEFSFQTSASSQNGTSSGSIWSVGNLVDDVAGIKTASGDLLYLNISVGLVADTGTINIIEIDGGAESFGNSAIDYRHGIANYIKIVRDESVGTYGTFYLYVYSDAARTNLVGSSTLTLNSSKKDFRYLYALQATTAGGNANVFGFSENLTVNTATAGYTATYPSFAITRITGLVHRYDREKGVYQLEMSLGDVSSMLSLSDNIAPRRATQEKEAMELRRGLGILEFPGEVIPETDLARQRREGLTGSELFPGEVTPSGGVGARPPRPSTRRTVTGSELFPGEVPPGFTSPDTLFGRRQRLQPAPRQPITRTSPVSDSVTEERPLTNVRPGELEKAFRLLRERRRAPWLDPLS